MTTTLLLAAALASSADPAPFGMRMRKPAEKVFAPFVAAPAPENEAAVVRMKDDSLRIFYIGWPEKTHVKSVESKDHGATWSEPRVEFALPGGLGHYGNEVVVASDGELHIIFHVYRGTKGVPGVDRNYDVWHARTVKGKWTEPKRFFEGYVGSLRGFVQLKSGRLVASFARAVPERFKPPPAGVPDTGWHNVIAFTSDDRGATWQRSPDELTVTLPGPNTTRYGAIEPHLVELKDGRVWMLIRDRGGHLYESYSADGSRWSEPVKTRFISSDSPTAVARLADGRLVIVISSCQRWDNPRSYAMGGREVLHAAISRDEGKTWQGFREVLTEPVPPVTRGDRGSAYPTAVQAADGKLVIVSGQGHGRPAVVRLDPDWLEERTASDDFSRGLVQWTLYEARGITLAEKSLAITSPGEAPTAAVWNFPAGATGRVEVRLKPKPGWKSGVLALTDHFNVSSDAKAEEHAIFTVPLPASLDSDRWHEVAVEWKSDGPASVSIDGKPGASIPRGRAAPNGVSYLRLKCAGQDVAGFEVASVKAECTPPGLASRILPPWSVVKRGLALDRGREGGFDSAWVTCPSVIAEDCAYRMWYSAAFDAKQPPGGIGYATSRDGLSWERANDGRAVLGVGPAGAFDSGQVLAPCVLRGGDGVLRMWYTGMPAGDRHSSGIGFYRIGLATSRDGMNWERANDGKPVLDLGPAGSPDEVQVATPCVLADGDGYRMWYAAWSSTHGHTIATATSRDGITWTKGTAASGLRAEAFGPEVIRTGDKFLMLYTALKAGRGFYAAESTDGLRWAPLGGHELLAPGAVDDFDAGRLGHAAMVAVKHKLRVWYTGYRSESRTLQLRIGAADLLPRKDPAP